MTNAWNNAVQGANDVVREVQKESEKVVEAVGKEGEKMVKEVARTVTEAASVVQDMTRSYSSVNLDDKDLSWLLARAAWDCYTFSGKGFNGRLKLLDSIAQNSKGDNKYNILQCGLYEIVNGRHEGKKILAYRGTDTSDFLSANVTIAQDLSLAFPQLLGGPIRMTIAVAVSIAQNKDPDFICGHSLGGLIAECVCGETGIPGASFNAPGPWGVIPANNLLTGNKYDGVKFEVHLTEQDPVSQVGSYMGPNHSHVGTPIWHSGGDHLMDPIIEELEK